MAKPDPDGMCGGLFPNLTHLVQFDHGALGLAVDLRRHILLIETLSHYGSRFNQDCGKVAGGALEWTVYLHGEVATNA